MTAPYWVRIRRTGDAFAGFTSPDGKEWTQRYGAAAAGIPKSIYIGYAVTSEVGGKPITATAHAVYFGTTPDLGPADYRVQLPAAVTMYFHAPGLTPGATYYWRVDEIEADAKTIHPGDVWSFTAQALLAYLPEPAKSGVSRHACPSTTSRTSIRPSGRSGSTVGPTAQARKSATWWLRSPSK